MTYCLANWKPCVVPNLLSHSLWPQKRKKNDISTFLKLLLSPEEHGGCLWGSFSLEAAFCPSHMEAMATRAGWLILQMMVRSLYASAPAWPHSTPSNCQIKCIT